MLEIAEFYLRKQREYVSNPEIELEQLKLLTNSLKQSYVDDTMPITSHLYNLQVFKRNPLWYIPQFFSL